MTKGWIRTRNMMPVNSADIPVHSMAELVENTVKLMPGKRLVMFFGVPKPDKQSETVRVYTVLADDEKSILYISSADASKGVSYPSLTVSFPSFQNFERLLWEEYGIIPNGHPWLKPVRYPSNRYDKSQNINNYPFFKMKGSSIHEVAVGPVHAGVIEPGHFRFECSGEIIKHLEIQLGYQHRAIEQYFISPGISLKSKTVYAEAIAGDSAVAHANAYAHAVEGLANMPLPPKVLCVRAVALELERIAMHLADLSALCNDVAYLTGSAVFGAQRTKVINTLLAICGNRFGKGLVIPGGVKYDISSSLFTEIRKTLSEVMVTVDPMAEMMFSSTNILGRFEDTGILPANDARQLGIVGLSARASGISIDVRADHPFGIYKYCPTHKLTMGSCDIFARAYLRFLEIKSAFKFINEQLDLFSSYNELSLNDAPAPAPDMMVVSLVEGWRGEIAHAAMTDKKGNLVSYRIKDPSFNNWFALMLAVRENEISDFPICNKSFNLSYCGHDL